MKSTIKHCDRLIAAAQRIIDTHQWSGLPSHIRDSDLRALSADEAEWITADCKAESIARDALKTADDADGFAMACRWAIEDAAALAIIAADEAAEQEQINRDIAEAEATRQQVEALHDLVCESLGLDNFDDWDFAATGSRYCNHEVGEHVVHLRVSDHKQVAGGGFNELTGERNGEVDCDFYIGESWTRESIRHAVAEALMSVRC